MKAGEWEQEQMMRAAKFFLQKQGYEYTPPDDLAGKMEKILKQIEKRIFEYPRLVLKRKVKQTGKESYDYVYKHYILTVLMNFKNHMGSGIFDYRNYYTMVERDIEAHGRPDYKVAGITEESLDAIISVYKKRIFKYRGLRGNGND
jgi:hypothetical protein